MEEALTYLRSEAGAVFAVVFNMADLDPEGEFVAPVWRAFPVGWRDRMGGPSCEAPTAAAAWAGLAHAIGETLEPYDIDTAQGTDET